MPLIAEIEAVTEELTAWRRDIHSHPELGFNERRTADLVAEKLVSFGLEVYRNIGKTGVVGVLRVGNEPQSIGLRADMDALPIIELNDFAHKSTLQGTMHACGHDGHTTMLLGAARYLAQTRNFRGVVNFIFQPAEEGIGGAQAMIEDGLFQQFPCDVLYGMHNAPGMPVGVYGASAGTMTAAGAFFDIDIHGTGAHGAFPHDSVDPVIIAAELVTSLQTVVSRNMRPTETAVLSITQIHSGDAYNVIPETARLAGTVRTFSMKAMDQIEARVRQLSSSIAAAYGGSATVDFRVVFHPVVNDAKATGAAADVCDGLVGDAQVKRDLPAGTGSEDFSFMLEQVPGCYLLVGNGDAEHMRPVHNPHYDFNDAAIPYGASFYAAIVEQTLAADKV
ncbi:MAG: M20 family metallopeptidase [Proteobacteria bacterium]|nr:M20 family metallopeptidase [Pseudomonadota bacterium]